MFESLFLAYTWSFHEVEPSPFSATRKPYASARFERTLGSCSAVVDTLRALH